MAEQAQSIVSIHTEPEAGAHLASWNSYTVEAETEASAAHRPALS